MPPRAEEEGARGNWVDKWMETGENLPVFSVSPVASGSLVSFHPIFRRKGFIEPENNLFFFFKLGKRN